MKEQTWQQWARVVISDGETLSLLHKGCLAALTGSDVRALDAFVPIMKLYAYTGDRGLLSVAGYVLLQMQDSTRWIARELIPMHAEWDDRERLWARIVGADLRAVSS